MQSKKINNIFKKQNIKLTLYSPPVNVFFPSQPQSPKELSVLSVSTFSPALTLQALPEHIGRPMLVFTSSLAVDIFQSSNLPSQQPSRTLTSVVFVFVFF